MRYEDRQVREDRLMLWGERIGMWLIIAGVMGLIVLIGEFFKEIK